MWRRADGRRSELVHREARLNSIEHDSNREPCGFVHATNRTVPHHTVRFVSETEPRPHGLEGGTNRSGSSCAPVPGHRQWSQPHLFREYPPSPPVHPASLRPGTCLLFFGFLVHGRKLPGGSISRCSHTRSRFDISLYFTIVTGAPRSRTRLVGAAVEVCSTID